MFDMNDLFLESYDSFEDDYNNDATLTTTEEGFVWCDCYVDESDIIDGDPFEFITEAMYQNVVNANNISLAILADNYKYLRENGVELVTEAEEAKKQSGKKLQAIKDFFGKVKQKIQKFFETIIEKMQTLQAKFLILFKKAREKGSKNNDAVAKDFKVPGYYPEDVANWAQKQYDNLVNNFSSDEFKDDKSYLNTDFNKEMYIIKNYGKHVSNVKKMKNSALKALDKQEKEMQKYMGPERARNPLETETSKETHTNYAKVANGIMALSKEAVNLIMTRVNIAAKYINKCIGYKDKSDSDKKEATKESASFLDRIEMI